MRAAVRIKSILKFIDCVKETFDESEKDGKLAEDLFDYIESIKFSLEDILLECDFNEYIIIPVKDDVPIKIAQEGRKLTIEERNLTLISLISKVKG